MTFYGKTALITGGASGIGKEHSIRLAKQGAKIAILDIDEKGLKVISSISKNIIPFKCDVTNLKQVREVVTKVENEIGHIDRLIHCAAIMPGGLLSEVSAEHINKVMTINYFGMVNITTTVLPSMIKRNFGDIIVYGSTAGIVTTNRFGAYGATKAATNFFIKVLIQENRHTKIRFQLVCPPAVDTPLINQAKDSGPRFLRDIQKTKKNMVSAKLVVESVEKCLEKQIEINYPGPAKWVKFLYPLFPNFIIKFGTK